MTAQRIETNMFAFPSHPFEIFLEFHSEIEGKEIHSECIQLGADAESTVWGGHGV